MYRPRRILPEARASTSCPPSISTRNMAEGSVSRTTPCTRMTSFSFGINRSVSIPWCRFVLATIWVAQGW